MKQTEYLLINAELCRIKEALDRLQEYIDHRIEQHRD